MIKKIKNLVKNLKRLANLNINDINELKRLANLNIYDIDKLKKEANYLKRELSIQKKLNFDMIMAFNKLMPLPTVLSFEETIDKIIDEKISYTRFGEGAFEFMQGKNIIMEEASNDIVEKVRRTFYSNHPKIGIGISNFFKFEELDEKYSLLDITKEYYINYFPKNYFKIYKMIPRDRVYLSAEGTQLYQCLKNYDFDSYFKKVRRIFEDRDITIICGGESIESNILSKLEYNVFDSAKSIEYQFTPRLNSFSMYDSILENAKTIDKNRLIILIFSIAGRAMIYELVEEGYQVLDMGHMAKDYDSFMRKEIVTSESALKFMKPD